MKNVSDLAEGDLQQKLESYGLNPGEWVVRRIKKHFFCAVHRGCQDWVLVGASRQKLNRFDWAFLELMEL